MKENFPSKKQFNRWVSAESPLEISSWKSVEKVHAEINMKLLIKQHITTKHSEREGGRIEK